MATVLPSTQPSSRKRWRKASTNGLQTEAVVAPRKPIIGNFPDFCARAASGHAAAVLPTNAMKSRRLMAFDHAEDYVR
jgi:hypothetical protein